MSSVLPVRWKTVFLRFPVQTPVLPRLQLPLWWLDDLNKATQRLDALREQAKEYVDEAGKNRLAYDNAIAENKQLLARIEALEKELQNNRQTANA